MRWPATPPHPAPDPAPETSSAARPEEAARPPPERSRASPQTNSAALAQTNSAALPAIDAHFWDWSLWLGAKRLRGRDSLVGAELVNVWHHLLRPLGVGQPPANQHHAITSYRWLRRQHEQRLGVTVLATSATP